MITRLIAAVPAEYLAMLVPKLRDLVTFCLPAETGAGGYQDKGWKRTNNVRILYFTTTFFQLCRQIRKITASEVWRRRERIIY